MKKEKLIEFILKLSAVVTILTTVGILYVLLSESISFFKEVSIIEFLTNKEWTPLFVKKNFGILPLVTGTLLTTSRCIRRSSCRNYNAIYLNEYKQNI